MLPRDHCNSQELWAHRRLDALRMGVDVPDHEIRLALWILGEVE